MFFLIASFEDVKGGLSLAMFFMRKEIEKVNPVDMSTNTPGFFIKL